jgi:hypothetical protein
MKTIGLILVFMISLNNQLSKASKNFIFSIEESNCLAVYYGTPEKLLTYDLLEPILDFEGQTPEISTAPISLKDYMMTNCEWKIDRNRRIVRLSKIIKMRLYDKSPEDRFHQKYHTKTESELAENKELYKTEVEEKVENENTALIGDAMDFNFQYFVIDGVGDNAVWEHKVNDLIVRVGEYQFTVNVKVVKDNKKNMDLAIKIANAILAKACP